jgi:CheY-like chemotaxis protein
MSRVPALAENTCPKTPSTTQTDSPTVLIVDDYDGVLGVIAAILLQEGYRVIPFEKAKAALQYLQEDNRVDLIISDVIMPGISGCALARSIRRLRPQTPMLFVTGYNAAAVEVHLECGDKCVVRTLQKPFTMQQLLSSVTYLLHGAHAACLGGRPGGIPAGSEIARKAPHTVVEAGTAPMLTTGQVRCHSLKVS